MIDQDQQERDLALFALRGYRPRARVQDARIVSSWYNDDENQMQAKVLESIGHYFHPGEIITTTAVQEYSIEAGWVLTQNTLYLVESWGGTADD